MNGLLDSLKDCIDALKARGKDAADKAAAMADELAAWFRSQGKTPTVGASANPADATRIAALEAECQALPAPTVGASPTVGALDFARIKKWIEFVLGLLK